MFGGFVGAAQAVAAELDGGDANERPVAAKEGAWSHRRDLGSFSGSGPMRLRDDIAPLRIARRSDCWLSNSMGSTIIR